MQTQPSTIETSFSPFGSGLKFESTNPTDPPEGGGGTGTGTGSGSGSGSGTSPSPTPPEEEPPQ